MTPTKKHGLHGKEGHRNTQLAKVKAKLQEQVAMLEAKLSSQQSSNVREEMVRSFDSERQRFISCHKSREESLCNEIAQICKCMDADLDCGLGFEEFKKIMKAHIDNMLQITDSV